ncbi:MAG: hypothetical protein JST49_09475 [Bacteroidetes bacterium]|nr:hypothetical protein [Bacteroidota bacterium]
MEPNSVVMGLMVAVFRIALFYSPALLIFTAILLLLKQFRYPQLNVSKYMLWFIPAIILFDVIMMEVFDVTLTILN